MAEPQDTPNNTTPPENPTLGRRAGYHLDEKGNVSGIWFTVDVDNFVAFTDQAIDLTSRPQDPRKSAP
jgi:hypothetical protein